MGLVWRLAQCRARLADAEEVMEIAEGRRRWTTIVQPDACRR